MNDGRITQRERRRRLLAYRMANCDRAGDDVDPAVLDARSEAAVTCSCKAYLAKQK